jgi:HEPN domain-containing protein
MVSGPLTSDQKNEVVTYWATLAQYDIETARAMYDSARYPYALFMCHSALEKILKALVVRESGEHADYTHNLPALANDITGIQFTDDQKKLLTQVNQFNMKARYPEWQLTFYKQATKEFTTDYMTRVNELYIWLTTFLPK